MANRYGGGEAPLRSPPHHCRHGFSLGDAPTTSTRQVVSWSRSGFIATSPRPRVQWLSAGGSIVLCISGPVMSAPRQGTAVRYEVCHAKRAGMNSPSPSKLIDQSPSRRKARCLGLNYHAPRRYLSHCTSDDGVLNNCRHVTRARWSTS